MQQESVWCSGKILTIFFYFRMEDIIQPYFIYVNTFLKLQLKFVALQNKLRKESNRHSFPKSKGTRRIMKVLIGTVAKPRIYNIPRWDQVPWKSDRLLLACSTCRSRSERTSQIRDVLVNILSYDFRRTPDHFQLDSSSCWEEKEEIWLSPMTKVSLPSENSKHKATTQNATNNSVTHNCGPN